MFLSPTMDRRRTDCIMSVWKSRTASASSSAGKAAAGKRQLLVSSMASFLIFQRRTNRHNIGLRVGSAKFGNCRTVRPCGICVPKPAYSVFNTDTDSEIVFGLENRALPQEQLKKRLEETCSELHLSSLRRRNIFELSGGEKQKLPLHLFTPHSRKLLCWMNRPPTWI